MVFRAWVVAAAAVVFALALVWLVQPRVAEVTAEPVAASTVSSPEAIVADTNVSGSAAPAFRPRPAAPARAETVDAPLPAAGPLPGATTNPESAGDVPRGLAERDRSFAAEPVDAEWAPGAEADILRRLAEQPALKIITMRVECRTTMCRLELTLPASTAMAANALPPDRTLELRPTLLIASRDPSGAPSTVMYFMRPGHEPELLRRATPPLGE